MYYNYTDMMMLGTFKCVVNLYSSTVQLPVLKVIEPVSH